MDNPVKKIKICFFNCYFPDASGGSEYQTYLLANSLDRDRYDVFFLSLSTSREGFFEEEGIRIYFFKNTRKLIQLDKGYLQNYQYFKSVFKREQPDIVYQRMANSATGILAHLAGEFNYHFIWACASTHDLQPVRWHLGQLRQLPENLLRLYGIKNTGTILLQTDDQRQMLEQSFTRTGTILKNAHPVPQTTGKKSADSLTVLFIGNFKKLKQPEMFIALAKAFAGDPRLSFLMIGRGAGGEYQQQLDAQIATVPNLRWLGEESQDAINERLETAFLLVNTSRYEGFSNTFIQAWLRRVPVLSLIVDPDGLLSRRGLGLVSGSFDSLCSDLGRFVADRLLRDTMGERGREYAIKEHALERIADQFHALIEQLLEEKSDGKI